MFWAHKWYLVSCFLLHFYFVLISCFLRLRANALLLLIVCVSEFWILSCQPMRRYSVQYTFFCNLFILHLWIGSLMQLPMLKSGSFLGMSDVCKGVGRIMQCRFRQGCFNAWMPIRICCPTSGKSGNKVTVNWDRHEGGRDFFPSSSEYSAQTFNKVITNQEFEM